MSKNFWLLLIASFIVFPLYSQSAVGIKFDINGMPLHGYHNPLTYLSKKSISKMNNDETFENGFYIDFAGKKYEGLIKFQHQKIVFKPNENASKIKIKPSEIQSFVVGQDSCLTISNYYNNKTNVAEHSFLQFVTKLDNGLAFAIKHKPKSKSYFIKRPKNDLWEIVNKKFFKKHALQYFGHIPYLKNKIEAKEYTHENLEPIIKMMEYHEKFLNKKPIYYNQYWQETTKPKNAKFKAFITDRSNDRWTLSYFQNDTLLYKANYTSFFPHKKEGEFIAYYANGKTRQTNVYKDDILTNVKVFYKSGVVKEAYKLKKVKARNSKTTMHRVYETVNDSLGHTILTDNLVSTINRTDPITGEKYTFTYKDRLLINAYRIDKKDTIYQLTDLNNKLDLIGLQSTFNSFSDHKNYNNAILKNAQGTILLALTMNKKGKAIKGKLLTTIHPEIDRIVKDFLNQKIINTTRPFKFKPLKINEVKQYYEMVVPFEFGIKRFYRNPVFYNWYFHQFMFQQFNQLNTRMTF